MKCLIVDDEPLAREAIEVLVEKYGKLELVGHCKTAAEAGKFIEANPVDLIFLDIRMPGITGLEFARTIPRTTLVIFTTAYGQYALDSYEVDAVDYLVKPVKFDKFSRAADKAIAYHDLLTAEEKNEITAGETDHFFIKSDRRFHKVFFSDILFVEGLKDYVVVQMASKRLITKMTIKSMVQLLPPGTFMRVNRSFIINTDRIDSFDTNDIYIAQYEIGIGEKYRDAVLERFFPKKTLL